MPLFVVTGAHGFIGNNLVDRLLSLSPEHLGLDPEVVQRFSHVDASPSSSNIQVIGSDLPGTNTRATALRFIGSARYTYVDHENLLTFLKSLPQVPLAVIHNGACSSTTETDPEIFKMLNLDASKTLWEYCSLYKIPFIYASSAAVYGNGQAGFSDKKEDCVNYKSLNLYGQSKLDFDLWTLKQRTTPPVWFGLRYFNVFGQFESHKGSQASMVYHGYQQATRSGKIRLFKSNTYEYRDGDQQRDFIYVDDIVSVTIELLRMSISSLRGGKTLSIPDNGLFLNLGRGVAETWNLLAEEVFRALDISPLIEYIPIPENIAGQYQNYTCADLSTLRELGVQHSFQSLNEGISRYVRNHLMLGR